MPSQCQLSLASKREKARFEGPIHNLTPLSALVRRCSADTAVAEVLSPYEPEGDGPQLRVTKGEMVVIHERV